jgi:hypothetical protein
MYSPPTFMTLEVVERIVGTFTWPVSYTLEDADPDGVWMIFPSGTRFCFYESFESEMELMFGIDTKTNGRLRLIDAVEALRHDPDYEMPPSPSESLEGMVFGGASLARVEAGLRDLCKLALAYLQPYMRGDRHWIEAYHRYLVKA